MMAASVFFLRKHSRGANDVSDIFHLHTTQPVLIRIRFAEDVLLDRITIQTLVENGGYQETLGVSFQFACRQPIRGISYVN